MDAVKSREAQFGGTAVNARAMHAIVAAALLLTSAGCGGGGGGKGGAAGEGAVEAPPRALDERPLDATSREGVPAGSSAAAPPAGTDTAAAGEECPMYGLWRPCSVQERLERSGFVVQPGRDSVGQPGLGISGTAYRLGSAELQLYLYADSVDARREASALDARGARPAVVSGVLRPPAVIRSNNLLALLFNNNDRQLERVQLALTAGLPAR